MARRIGVFRPESGAEGVDFAQRHRTQLPVKLSGDCKAGVFAEKVLAVVNLPLRSARQVFQIEGGHLEHFARPLRIGAGNQRRVQIYKAVVVEILVDGKGHGMAQPHHTAEIVGAETQMGDFTQEFHAVPLFLQGIFFRIGNTQHRNFSGLNLNSLPFSH